VESLAWAKKSKMAAAAAIAGTMAGLDYNEQLKKTNEARRTQERRSEKPPPANYNDGGVSHKRIEETMLVMHDERKKNLEDLFKKYDTNNSGVLEIDQVCKLLTDLDSTTPPGTAPSDDEVQYILRVADSDRDDALSLKEVEHARFSWNVYIRKREQMAEAIQKFDKSGTGKLEKPELKEYLIDLNHGHPVSDKEVDWVFDEANVFKDDGIHQTELCIATARWYVHVVEKEQEEKKQQQLADMRAEDEANRKQAQQSVCCVLQ